MTLSHRASLGSGAVNELRFQVGQREYFEPTNSDELGIWYNSGVTLQTGSNILGDLLGDGTLYELRDTFYWTASGGLGTHAMKAGLSVQRVEETSVIDLYEDGLLIYADAGLDPLVYVFGVGSSEVDVDTMIYGAFFQDDWKINDQFTLSLGLRYDYDSDGNNPDFTHPLVPNGRDVDDDNFQPRVSFTWDPRANGSTVIRGGAGLFSGRYLLVPSFTELQQNGVTGRRLFSRVDFPPFFPLDPNNPANTGFLLAAADITLLDTDFRTPEALQTSLGFTQRLGNTGLFLDVEAIYVDGDDEIIVRDTNWRGNANPGRINAAYGQINSYTNEGRSKYKALVVALNGQLEGGHIITGSVTLSEKKNISDDFSPEFPFGYPSDPADIEAEYADARGNEDIRVVLSGVFRLPYDFTIAPIAEYGSGQPWNRLLGYDFNGDGKISDRAAGVSRNSEDGPSFKQVSVRVTKGFAIGDARLELIAEAFNVFDWTNYDVSSIDNRELLLGPTLANPTVLPVANPTFGNYRATLPPREIQLGVRYQF
ncbi:MAG: TonB-dependent receptor [Acidobacteria bacterium]|nr:TonB-dependent receptor [Acidobacteriota bacterium]